MVKIPGNLGRRDVGLIDWSTAYSVKVETIDQQHKKLFSMVNELHEAARTGKGAQVVPRLLKDLLQYTRQHFAFEEAMMVRGGYPQVEAHKAEHEELTLRVVQMAREVEGRGLPAGRLLFFLCDWLTQHILGHDKKNMPYV